MLFQAAAPAPTAQSAPARLPRSATLDRAGHTIDVGIQAAARVSATVIIARHGVRLGRAGGSDRPRRRP